MMFVFSLAGLTCLGSCENKQYRHDEIMCVPSEDTVIQVKISYPENWTKNDKIIVWSMPPLNSDFLADSITDNRNLWIGPILRTALLNSGYVNIEYIGRNDSIGYKNNQELVKLLSEIDLKTLNTNRLNKQFLYFFSNFNNYKSNIPDAQTKAKDLENLLNYIHAVKQLKNKKIVLVGHSEGGYTNSIVASKKQYNISAILQLATVALRGKEISDYQREQTGYKDLLVLWGGGDQARMDSTANKWSSLDSYHKANIDGIKQFFKENTEPLEEFIYRFDTMDSIYYYIDSYLRDRWEKEDRETKDLCNNDFNTYYYAFAGYITPQQITLKKFDPEKYYPFIKCPVLAVHGTEDKRIDCFPNIENMEKLLKKGGNPNFEKIILEGYNHFLTKGNEGHVYVEIEGKLVSFSSKPDRSIEDDVIERIVGWIDKQ